jgi:glycosyltransferase involved in cell wall biosynthesis
VEPSIKDNQFVQSSNMNDELLPPAVYVDIIIPVHNAAETLVSTVDSALNQKTDPECSFDVRIAVCCYDDGSQDDSWKILQELKQKHDASNDNVTLTRTNECGLCPIPTKLVIAKSVDGVSRGAGFARNRAVELGASTRSPESSDQDSFLCMLDSDDTMLPTRVIRQLEALFKLPKSDRCRTLMGCTFSRDPPDATWHYAKWANGLTDERLSLERYREVTVLQPTWMIPRKHFQSLGGYLEAPLESDTKGIEDSRTSSTIHSYLKHECNLPPTAYRLVHPDFETPESLRVAEDLRFFHSHFASNGLVRLHREPLIIYKHRDGQSQSSQTSRKLLLYLRARAFEDQVLRKHPRWIKASLSVEETPPTASHDGSFVVWGAGRDGKDFCKALSADARRRIYCMVDVDDKKISSGWYVNRESNIKIPIVHFSLLSADPSLRETIHQSHKEEGPGFGRIDKSRCSEAPSEPARASKKRRMTTPNVHSDFDVSRLPSLPVVVCVAMYRTNGALEHNVQLVGRVEGEDLWHFS